MEQATMSEAELTILSLLAEAERYGHEIQQVIEQRGLRAWVPIGFASVYYLLSKLERQNLLTGDLIPDHQGVPRKRYRLTDAGQGVLQTAVADLLRQPHALGEGFELGLANLHVLKPHQVYQTLSHHHADLQTRLERIEKDWQQHQNSDHNTDNVSALYTHSIAVMRAELEWMTAFLEAWKARYPAADRAPSAAPDETAEGRKTRLSRRTTPEPAKMIQKLKRPKPPESPQVE